MTDISWADKVEGDPTNGSVSADDMNAIKAAVNSKEDSTALLTKHGNNTVTALTPGATVTPDCATVSMFTLAIDQNSTLANPDNLLVGQSIDIEVTQDSTPRTLSFGTHWDFPGGAPSLSEGSGDVDHITGKRTSSTRIVAGILKDLS